MNLTAYRKTVERRLQIIRCLVALFLIALVAMRLYVHIPEDDPRNFITGMITGMGCAGSIIAAIITVQQTKALKDENKLRQLYIAEHDERCRLILQKAGHPIIIYLSLCLIAAGMIAGFFNIAITIALTAAAIFQLLVSCIVKFVCMKKM